uniref:peptidylprolyl isomerase n=1 Tax=Setaria digitata TaxID=48799 RepID=A0A915PG71_9BILA
MDNACSSLVVPPEYDEELNHLFFAKKFPSSNDSGKEMSDPRKNFYNIYKAFVENRQNLINELRNIADKSICVKKGCTISTITGSSFGIAGGTAAIAGTVVYPPLLLGGLVVAGLATASNLGTQLTEFILFRNMVKKVESLSKYDIELMRDIEDIYQNALDSNLFETAERSVGIIQSMDTATNDLPSLGLQIGAGGAKSATVLGLRSVGIQVAEIGSTLLKGVARGAIGIGVIIDGVTMFLSARDIAMGCSTKFSDRLNSLADFKEKELGEIMTRIDVSNLLLEEMSKRKVETAADSHVDDGSEDISTLKKNKVLPYEQTYLRSIPHATQYEKSFMHRDTITHVIATATDFIITASIDGHLKFWKKKHGEGIEFVKHFRCHLHAFSHLTINHNGTLMATVCTHDKSVKIFDVPNFDMINMFNTEFAPRTAAWIHQGNDVIQVLAISDSRSGNIYIYDGKGEDKPIRVLDKIHLNSVKLIEYNPHFDCVISVDSVGMLEYWSGPKRDYQFPDNVKWIYKTDTDLYEFVKVKAPPRCLLLAPNGKSFAAFGADRRIRIFDFASGKLIKMIDETLRSYMDQAAANKNYGLQNMEWNRRVALEKELDRDENTFQHLSICFDETSNFLIYPTPIGIKVYNLYTDEVIREIGKNENMRFLGVSLCRALPDFKEQLQGAAATIDALAATNPNLKKTDPDPMLVACAYRKGRFYLFTNAEPFSTEENDDVDGTGLGRDVFNEKPKKEDIITAVESDTVDNKVTEHAVIHTSLGDIRIRLFPNECPKAVENFCTHARRGYYNGHTFHRVIKSFMIQTGDPTGKGTGGQSIWGEDFEDEFHPKLRHDKPYMVSMANAGPNTNGSQFFITVIPADWLDGKNTLFGQVTEGFNVVQKINQVPTFEKSGRPKQEITIISITLK